MHSLALFLQPNTLDPTMVTGVIAAYLAIFAVFYIIGVTLIIIPTWLICKKAGFSPWLSLLCLLPSVGMLIALYVLALAEWPSQRVAAPLAYVPPTPPLPPQL